MLQSLIFVRREVTLEKVDINAAVNQTEIVLAGMRANDCLQDEIRAYLEPVARIVATFNDAITRIEAVCSDLPTKTESISKERETVARTVLKACDEMTIRAALDLKIVQARRAKLVSKMRWLGGQTEETKEVYVAMDKALDDLLRTTKEYRAKALQLETRLSPSMHAKTDSQT